jgi:hypothetical protein
LKELPEDLKAKTKIPNLRWLPLGHEPSKVEPSFDHWKNDPQGFYSETSNNQPQLHVKPSSGEVVVRHFLPQREPENSHRVRSIAASKAIAASGIIHGSFHEIEARLQDWVCRGRRYNTIVKDLEGLGALIFLSKDMDSL